jgi:O-antigen/teichoic acid export membrane protein
VATSKPISLTDRSLAAVKWNYLGVVARIASQLIAQIALARLLGPEAFGLFAVAFLVVMVGNILVEMGLGSALVQKKHITDNDVRFAFTWVVVAGLAMATMIFLLSGTIASYFHDPRVADITRGLIPVFIFQALAVVPLSLLKRDLAFKAVQGVQIASYLFGFLLVGVGAALLGAGVWSLVAAWFAQTLSSAIIFNLIRRHAMKPLFNMRDKALRDYGARVLLTNMANWTIENVDNLLVGKIFGPTALGLYSVSYNLVRTPANHLVVTLQTVLFPASAQSQDNHDGLRRAYLTVVAGVALIALPAFGGAAAVSETVVDAFFGNKWIGAAPVLLPLALAMILHALMAVAGPVLWGQGAAGSELKVQFWVALALVAALLIAAQYSMVAVAWAVCAVYAIRLIWMTAVLMRHIHLPLEMLLRALRGGILAGVVIAGLLLLLDLAMYRFASGFRLTFELGMSGLVLVMFVLLFPNLALSAELRWVVQRLLSRMPRLAQSVLLRRLGAGQASSSAPVAL